MKSARWPCPTAVQYAILFPPPAPGERCHRSLACRRVAVRPHAVFVIFRRRKEDARLLLTAGNLVPRARSPWAVVAAATENWIVSRKLLARGSVRSLSASKNDTAGNDQCEIPIFAWSDQRERRTPYRCLRDAAD